MVSGLYGSGAVEGWSMFANHQCIDGTYSHGLESEKTSIQGEAESQIMSPKE